MYIEKGNKSCFEDKTAELCQDAGSQTEGRTSLIYVLSPHPLSGPSCLEATLPIDDPQVASAQQHSMMHLMACGQEDTKAAQHFGVHKM